MTTVLDNERVCAWRLHLEPGASFAPVTVTLTNTGTAPMEWVEFEFK